MAAMKSDVSLGVQRAVKRALDVALAAILLIPLLPIMMAIGAAVRATSPGEVIFRQERAGKDGRAFTIYKFRTITNDPVATSGTTLVHEDDPRITRVGRLLRRTSLDELPQIFNVLRGDMSFVGPRPDLPHHVERYSSDQRRRLAVRPGITGWAQVAGRNDLPWEDRIKLDIEYLDDWSLKRDFEVIVRTFAVVVSGKGAAIPKTTREMPCDIDPQTR